MYALTVYFDTLDSTLYMAGFSKECEPNLTVLLKNKY